MKGLYGRVLYLHGIATLMTVHCATRDEYQKEIDAAFKWAESERGDTGVWGQCFGLATSVLNEDAADGAEVSA